MNLIVKNKMIVIQNEKSAPEKLFYFLDSKRKTYQHQNQSISVRLMEYGKFRLLQAFRIR